MFRSPLTVTVLTTLGVSTETSFTTRLWFPKLSRPPLPGTLDPEFVKAGLSGSRDQKYRALRILFLLIVKSML